WPRWKKTWGSSKPNSRAGKSDLSEIVSNVRTKGENVVTRSSKNEVPRRPKKGCCRPIYIEGTRSAMYTPSLYRALDVRVAVREHGLESMAERAGVDELTLARYCLRLDIERGAARAIESALLTDVAA